MWLIGAAGVGFRWHSHSHARRIAQHPEGRGDPRRQTTSTDACMRQPLYQGSGANGIGARGDAGVEVFY